MSKEKGNHAECKQLVRRRRRYAFGIIYDPKTDLNISISFNEYAGCNVILTKNNSLLLIVTEVTFSEQDKKHLLI